MDRRITKETWDRLNNADIKHGVTKHHKISLLLMAGVVAVGIVVANSLPNRGSNTPDTRTVTPTTIKK